MPTSDPSGIAPVIWEVMKLRPQSILDVGVGMGKWGMLFREYLEGWHFHRFAKPQWTVQIDGVEVYEPYIQPWHRELYNTIHIGDVRKLELPAYDFIYFGDVIEHMPKPEGLELLRRLKFKTAIVSTPAFKTKEHRGKPNPHQDHLSFWQAPDFRPFKNHRVIANHRLLIVRIDK